MEQPDCLQVNNLTFSVGDKMLLNGLSFEVVSGKKVALLGLNGAGKSCLIRTLTGEFKAEKGEISFQSLRPTEKAFKDKLGYQASGMLALPNLSCREYLTFCCSLKSSLSGDNQHHYIELVSEQWNLTENMDIPLTKLSQGNLQKLFVAQAFLGNPEYIILDEPSQALDPIEQQRFIDNLNKLSYFRLCLFSSHHVNEAVRAADSVMMLHHGRLIAILDLHSSDEFWLVTKLSEAEILELFSEDSNISVYPQSIKNLVKFEQIDIAQWQLLVKRLSDVDPSMVELGCGENALMPMFALLANEDI
ncbi:ATP-binding cassette domain-containing protein [Aliikangiella coralliicola]|uniref:ABC transporter ATP-binding protein n=1 Tax=Aliikangiella coralliicola TaxID=2592383 RepID=A0A545UHM6_9GAMM|nr:ABC transporter ATP-binding protein [Aliikangiella coralliicola]TQV88958.1 ABC transporter ATP-binding protein [Aliikangiella coralliicola]